MNRHNLYHTIYEQGAMPLFYHPDPELGKQVLNTVYEGGGRLLEFTNRGDFAHEVFAELSQYVQSELPSMYLGVGSVVDGSTAALFIQLGARFVVSASLREDIATICNRRKVAYMPGCGSLTEIGRAEELGCEIVKLFPGSVYGPGFIKAIRGPQPWTSIMPTGGVSPTEENMRGWFEAGAVCLGMGSKLIDKETLTSNNWNGLRSKVEHCLKLAIEIRAQ